MYFPNDPFFEEAPPPSMSLYPHLGSGSRRADPHRQALVQLPFGGMGMGLMPFGGPSPFSMMNGMMSNMDNMMRAMHGGAAGGAAVGGGVGGHSFSSSSSTVMQFSSDGGGGQPRVYHATSSTRQAPGGVKETRKAERDSHTGVQKMAVGHHIGERSHVIERHLNARTGERAKNQEFVNLEEDEADSFGEEWREKTRPFNHTSAMLRPGHTHPNQLAESRGLPSTSRPANPGEGGRPTRSKRKTRPVSQSEDGDHAQNVPIATATTSRSPKLSRTKSPPYVPKPKPDHPDSHSHSTRYETGTDLPPIDQHTTEGGRARKKKGGKKTTFACDL